MPIPQIVLVNPPMNFEIAMGKIKNLGKLMIQLPLGIAYIASYLKKSGISKINIIDSSAENLSVDETVDLCLEKQTEILEITCVTAAYPVVCEIARKFKQKKANSTVVVGGEHPSVLPEETLKNEFLDIAVRGEGELTFLELVKCLGKGKSSLRSIAGISYKEDDRIFHNQNREHINDLDAIPFPAYELLPMHLYNAPPHWEICTPSFQLMASRGCPCRCTFCSLGVMGKNRRIRSPKNVIREIEYLINNYNARQIMFSDAIFPVNKKEGMTFCNEIINSKLNEEIVWVTECRVNVVDEDLLNTMYEAGCRLISYGIESGVQELLDNVKKDATVNEARKAISLTKKAKIRTFATYILGFPGETKELSLRTLEFAKELDTDYAQFNLMVPYPGSPLFDEALEKGILKPTDWEQFLQANSFTQYDPIYAPEGMDKSELKKLSKLAYKKYYLRPRMFFKHLKYIRSLRDMTRYIEVGKALIRGVW